MRFLQSPRDRLIGQAARTVDFSQGPQDERQKAHCGNPVILAKFESEFSISFPIVDFECLLRVFASPNKIAFKPTSHSATSMGNAGFGRGWLSPCIAQKGFSGFFCERQFGTSEAAHP